MTTEPTEAYVGSLWHQHCDPFVTVIGYNEREVKAKLDELEEEEESQILDGTDDEINVNIMTGGVTLEFDISDYLPPGTDGEAALADLQTEHLTVF